MSYASLKQYPPERTTQLDNHADGCPELSHPDGFVGSACTCGAIKKCRCSKAAKWTVLGYGDTGTFAEFVCAQHLGEIWNEQGRPA